MALKKEHFFYFFVYVLSAVFLLTTQGMFWDDWVVFQVNPNSVLDLYTMSGRPLFGHFFNTLFSIDPNGFVIFRILIFVSFLIPIFILNKLLTEIVEISASERIAIVALFSIIPVNSSRIAITMSQYSFCNLLFFSGFLTTLFFLKSKNIFLRIISLGLFYVSFTMDSLMVFFATVLLFIFYKERASDSFANKRKFLESFKTVSIKYLDFILLPVLYLVIKTVYYQPYGLYANYNKITLFNFAKSIVRLPASALQSIAPVIKQSLATLISFPLLHIVSNILFFFMLKSVLPKHENFRSRKTILYLILFGFSLIGLAVLPYYVVNAIPNMNNWSSRHQVLMPLGCSVVSLFSVDLIISFLRFQPDKLRQIRTALIALAITTFILTTLHTHLQYQKDWYKQLSMMSQFKKNDVMQTKTSFRFVDNTLALNATSRTYNFYELTGLMKYAFGNETRYGSLDEKFDTLIGQAVPFSQYNISQFKVVPYEAEITINYGSYLLDDKNGLKLVWQRIFNPSEFETSIDNIISIDAKIL